MVVAEKMKFGGAGLGGVGRIADEDEPTGGRAVFASCVGLWLFEGSLSIRAVDMSGVRGSRLRFGGCGRGRRLMYLSKLNRGLTFAVVSFSGCFSDDFSGGLPASLPLFLSE